MSDDDDIRIDDSVRHWWARSSVAGALLRGVLVGAAIGCSVIAALKLWGVIP